MERDAVWLVLKVASSLSAVIERVALKELGELQQTIYSTRSVVSSFVSARSSDPAFDICLASLQKTLEHTESVVGKFVVCSSDAVKSELLLEVGRLDFLVRQKSDQAHFLFVAKPQEAPASRIASGPARAMWSSAFGDSVRMVPWSEFLPVFVRYAVGGPHAHLEDEDAQTLAQFLDFTMDGWVSVYELEVFLRGFGPLEGSAQRLLNPYKAGILAGYVSSAEASSLLHGHEPGCFLIRFSKSTPGSFAVTFVDSKNRIKHCLLYSTQNGVTLREPPDVFPNLEDFVRAHKGRLRHGLAAQAQRPISGDWAVGGPLMPSKNPYTNSLAKTEGHGVPGMAECYSRDAMEMLDDAGGGDKTSLCVVCMAESPGVCFIPCGHVCACRTCAERINSFKEKKCPVCRNGIDSVQRIYVV